MTEFLKARCPSPNWIGGILVAGGLSVDFGRTDIGRWAQAQTG